MLPNLNESRSTLHYLDDPKLSLKEKGIIDLCLSIQELGEEVTIQRIWEQCSDSPSSIGRALQKLELAGYFDRARVVEPGVQGISWIRKMYPYKGQTEAPINEK